MFIPKRYGQSRKMDCPFCKKAATTENTQGIPTCLGHKDEKLPDLKCMCGSWLELRQGDWGPYFNCTKCGNMSFAKGMDRSVPSGTPGAAPSKEHKPTHMVVRSDDPRFVDD